MNKSILVSVAILTLSTSAALAAHRPHHGRAVEPNASAAATNPNPYAPYAMNPNPYGPYGRPINPNAYGSPISANARAGGPPVGWRGGVSSNDYNQYMKNLHDSGYDPKNDFNANGTMKQQ
jgi:hypothetical protein